MFCKKFAHIKKGSNAGSTLPSQRDMPFLADYNAVVGHMTMSKQQLSVRKAAANIFFFPNLKISMVYFIHKPWIYDNLVHGR